MWFSAIGDLKRYAHQEKSFNYHCFIAFFVID